MGQDKEKS